MYVGCTSQTLQDRIKQDVPKFIRSCSSSQKHLLPAHWCKSSPQINTQSPASDSAIGLHLLQNPVCAYHYDDSRFSIPVQGRSPFHVSAFGLLLSKLLTGPLPTRRICVQFTDSALTMRFYWSLFFQPIILFLMRSIFNIFHIDLFLIY